MARNYPGRYLALRLRIHPSFDNHRSNFSEDYLFPSKTEDETAGLIFDENRPPGFPQLFPVTTESDTEKVIGYLVCRVDENVVWAESLFVLPEYRRQGIGTTLYAKAEHLAQELGKDTPYNWVDPNNTGIIGFLQKRGYGVLNLIELRRARSEEAMAKKIWVGANEFDYY